ncbi:MAG: sugar ABC transporter ATP-binding protein [bacterium]
MTLLELKNISKDFPGVRALDDVSLDLNMGEIHAICGENGAGKSTLIKILCGCHPVGSYGGEIWLGGKKASFETIQDSEKAGLALIAQELALVPEFSVLENLCLGREPVARGLIDWESAEAPCREALQQVGFPVDLRTRVKDLGIGQQQLVEIAKALSKKARLLVLDEPTAALTESEAVRLLGLLRQLRTEGVSIIYISHRLEEVAQLADRVTVLRDGRSVSTGAVAQMPKEKIIAKMVGREVTTFYPRPSTTMGETLLSVENLNLYDPQNPSRKILDAVNLQVRAGEILGLGGLMGAGRTALLGTLFGAARGRVSGKLKIGGMERDPFENPREAIKHGVALVSEDRKRYGLVLELTVRENLILAILEQLTRKGLVDGEAAEISCEKEVRTLRIKGQGLDARAARLSGGNQQKVVLGKWFLTQPRVLLLDEPTRGIDVGAKAEIYELLGRLAAEGMAILLASSDLPELLGLSHRILVLNQGKPAGWFEGPTATAEKIMEAATAAGK